MKVGGQSIECENGDPNLNSKSSDFLTLREFSDRAGVDVRWLSGEVKKGKIPSVQEEGKFGRYGFRYWIDKKYSERVRLRYLRGKRLVTNLPKGFTSDGVDYLFDGNIRRRGVAKRKEELARRHRYGEY